MLISGSSFAQETQPIKVTPETYIRAESDRQFGDIVKMAGGLNKFFHFRNPTPLDKQNIVRMNRDTLYSMAIVDTSKGATITVPEGHFFAMGDNRDNSRDSRWFGFVPGEQIVGRATGIAMSFDPSHWYMPRWDRFFTPMP